MRGTTLQLDLVQHEAGDGAPFTLHRTGLDHLAFTVADRPELDGWAARLDVLGVGHSGAIDIPLGGFLSTRTPTASRSRSFGSAAARLDEDRPPDRAIVVSPRCPAGILRLRVMS